MTLASLSQEARALVTAALSLVKSEVLLERLTDRHLTSTPYLTARQVVAAALRVAGLSEADIALALNLKPAETRTLLASRLGQAVAKRLMKGRVQS